MALIKLENRSVDRVFMSINDREKMMKFRVIRKHWRHCWNSGGQNFSGIKSVCRFSECEPEGASRIDRNANSGETPGPLANRECIDVLRAETGLTQTFMTVCNTDITTPGKIIFYMPDQSKVNLDYNPALWSILKEKMELTTPEDQGLKHSWDGRTIWRILLTGKFLARNNSISYRIYK